MKSTVIKLGLVALALSTLNGCSSVFGLGKSDYGCPLDDTGVRCMSARDVYEATDRSPTGKIESVKKGDKTENGEELGKDDRGNDRTDLAVRNDTGYALVPTLDNTIPVRTRAEVLRIWIAPWEDSDGDLNASGFVFTEIEERKWNLGHKMVLSPGVSTPLLER